MPTEPTNPPVDPSVTSDITPEPDKKPDVSGTLQQSIKDRLANCGGEIREFIVESEAKIEIERRQRVGLDAFNLEKKLAIEFAKMKPDQVEYVTPGDEATAIRRWSPAKAEEYKKAKKTLDDLRAVFTKAFEVFDKTAWDKLEEMVKNLSKQGGDNKAQK